MSADIAAAPAARIDEHAAAHRLRSVNVVLHGGEPLLCGPDHLRTLLAIFSRMSVRANLTVQTNGLRLGEDFLELFDEFGIRVGISLDGGRAAHDRHRRSRTGQGSYERVRAAVRALAAREERFAGLLCTVDLSNDPIDVYEELISHRPPAIDFLLPHGNWSWPPPGRLPGGAGTPYADWLIAVFDRWYGAVTQETAVRIFDGILVLVLGGRSGTEGIGPEPAAVVVVESDGSIEQSDALKSAYHGAPRTGLNVTADSFDAVFAVPGVAVRRPAPTACHPCPHLRVCGGGHIAHRYRAGAGFDNPSVYCPDLYRLIEHISGRVAYDLVRLRA